MNGRLVFAGVLGLALGLMCVRGQAPLKSGTEAPEFKLASSDGKTRTLADLTAKGPVFLYFIKDGCPVNEQAIKYFKRLGTAYPKGNLVGVYNGDKASFDRWQAEKKVSFPVMLDPDIQTIRAYKAERSPWVVQVGKDRKVAKVWPGYSVADVKSLSQAIAKGAGLAVAQVDASGAPKETAFG